MILIRIIEHKLASLIYNFAFFLIKSNFNPFESDYICCKLF